MIREVCHAIGEIGEAEVQSYIYTQQEADTQRNFLVNWLRKGSMERWDMTRKIDSESPATAKGPANTLAFDGHLFSSLARHGSALIGEIKTVKQSGWAAMNRVDPFAFLYEYNTMPYSQIIAQGRNLEISTVVKDNQQLTRVSLRHPQFDWRGFVLFFDQDRRLLERQLIRYEESLPRIIQTHTFSDYTEHQDSSGETIWFPHKAVWHYYMGSLPDGTLVENTTDIVTIKEISFNVDIPDEQFTIEFPPGTKIWDGVNNLGWIDSIAERAQDDGLAGLIEAASRRTNAARQPANTDDQVIPASDVPRPLAAESPPTPITRRWPFYALLLTLAVFAVTTATWLLRKKPAQGRGVSR
ncbi:MAG: hypothetical protein JSU94_15300 [Phycisphaerales bacterium]|nr:MAG: hypothetical protein JSU94_15300 [Phycisphaerales bacterium]